MHELSHHFAPKVKVAVVGPGAIGGMVAAALTVAGHDVTICSRTGFNELVVESDESRYQFSVSVATHKDAVSQVDWVILATKAVDLAEALSWLDVLARADTRVVVIQNGIDHFLQIPPERTLYTVPAIARFGARREGRGHIVHLGGHELLVPDTQIARDFAHLFDESFITVNCKADFQLAAWRKLLLNLIANPLTSLTLRQNDIFWDKDVQIVARGILAEAIAVAQQEGIALTTADIDRTLRFYTDNRVPRGSSMLSDRLAGLPMEHEFLTGAIVRLAQRHGIVAPINHTILTLLRMVDQDKGAPLRADPPHYG